MYTFAKQYYAEHGNLDVPRRYKTVEGYSLGQWIFTQRKVYCGELCGTLGKERVQKLDNIGMIWGSRRDFTWQKYYKIARAYYDKFGNLNVPHDYKDPTGNDFAAWIRRIRTYRKSGVQKTYLTEERIEVLNKMGMIWSVPDYLWEENYAEALRFYREKGHLNVPSNYCAQNGLKIGAWIRRQRDLRSGKIKNGVPPTAEQIARLDEIGMVWKSKYAVAWERGYQASREYFEQNGNLDVAVAYTTPDGYRLGAWIVDRRQKGKENHSAEQQCLLDELGMIWKKPDSWEVRFELAKQYYENHGRLNIPASYKVEGIWLARWLSEQRQIYVGKRGKKRLTVDQIERLESIGMTWGIRNSRL